MENLASTKVSNQQILAKKYIEENNIEKIISEMLNSLVHDKYKQPIVYMIKYLAGLLSEQERKDYGLIIPEPFPKGKPIVKYPDLEKSNCLIKKYLNRNVLSSLKYNKTKNGGNIMNVIKYSEINPEEDKIGCILVDGSSINTFNKIFAPLLADLHNITTVDQEFRPSKEFSMKKSKSTSFNFPLHERISENVNKMIFSYSRNIQDFPYSAIISHEKRKHVEEIILKAIKTLNDDNMLKEGQYFTYNKNEHEIKEILNEIEFDENYLRTAELRTSWPDNRGIFATKEKDVIILINFIDHLELIVTTDNNSDFSAIYNYARDLIQSIERNVNFDVDKHYGYLNVNPLLVGAGLTISSDITLNNLTRLNDFAKTLEKLNFDSKIIKNSNLRTKSYCKLSNADELEFAEDYYSKISGLINIDKDKENIPANFNFNKIKLDDRIDKAISEAYERTYEELKYSISPSGMTLNSLVKLYIENSSNPLGIVLTESSDYNKFSKFISEYLKISQNFELEKYDQTVKLEENENLIGIKIPEKILSTDVCLIRNIADHPFPTSKLIENLKIEDMIVKALDNLRLGGKYISIENEMAEKIIQDNNLIIFHNNDYVRNGIEKDFPKNRGLIIFENYNQTAIHAVVNDFDHIKFQVHIDNSKLSSSFVNLLKISNEFSKQLKFVNDKRFGYLTACPKYLGTGMIIKSRVQVGNALAKQTHLIEETLSLKNFSYRIVDQDEGIIEIINKNTIGISENELIANFITVVNELTDMEI